VTTTVLVLRGQLVLSVDGLSVDKHMVGELSLGLCRRHKGR